MKNRTVIGIFCILFSLCLFFVLIPMFSAKTEGTVSIVRAAENIESGTKITADMLETVKVSATGLTGKELKDKNAITGKYASSKIFEGDALTAEKLNDTNNGINEALYSLQDGEYALTVSVSESQKGLAARLENGDIIRIYNQKSGEADPALEYVRVLTVLGSDGKSTDESKESGSKTATAAALMLAVNEEQAKVLLGDGFSAFVFVCHGDDARAEGYMAAQNAYFSGSVSSAGVK